MRKQEKNNETILSVTYPKDKMNAIRMFAKGDGDVVEQELLATMDRLYNRFVPPNVKMYLMLQGLGKGEAGESKSE